MTKAFPRQLFALLLAVLLVIGLSTTAFAAEVDTDTMKLNTPDESGNTAFTVTNMFPGDAETKDFTVKVDHKEPITLYYHADIRPGSEKLAEVMMVKIELPEKGVTLYDGLMRDMPSALEYQLAANEKEVIYRITAYLDTSVGNDYQYKSLIADFRWWYAEETEDPDPQIPDPVSVKIAAEKVMDGKYPRGKDFTFVLTDEAGNVIQTVNNRDGVIEFDTLTFQQEGTYTYTITEKAGSNSKIDYDDTVYKVIVTVTEGEDAYTASIAYEKDGEDYTVLPRFVNKTKGTNPPDDPDNPKTGDDSNIGLYLSLCFGSALAILLLLFFTKRKKEDKAV